MEFYYIAIFSRKLDYKKISHVFSGKKTTRRGRDGANHSMTVATHLQFSSRNCDKKNQDAVISI